MKRKSYDLGLSNPAFNESFSETFYDTSEKNHYSETFYQNKWYGFKRPEEDQRFEYIYEEETRTSKWLKNLYVKIGVVISAVLLYDFYAYWKRKRASSAASSIYESQDGSYNPEEPLTPTERYVLERMADRETQSDPDGPEEA